VPTSWALAALLGLVVANWWLWASAVPFGEAPDEPSHLEVAQFVADQARLPRFGPDADLYVRLDQVGIPIESHALAPPLPYLVDALLVRLVPGAPVAAARVGSLLAALVAVASTYALVRAFRPRDPTLALLVAAFVAVVPQVSFQAATVNSDVFALAAAAAVGWLWFRATRPRGALAFGVALGLALLTKYTVYPVAIVAAACAAWRDRHQASTLAALAAGTAVVAGPWLWHNWALYGAPWPFALAEAAFRAATPAVTVPGAPGSQQVLSREYARSWAEITLPSFWTAFGRLDLFGPGWGYALLLLGAGLAALGLLRTLAGPSSRAAALAALRQPRTLLLLAWPSSVFAAAVLASTGRYYPVHGRYLLPALPPLALGLVLGWRALAPGPWRVAVPAGVILATAALNLYCLLAVVVPHYHGPAARRVVVTVDTPRPGDVATPESLVRGWAVLTGRPAWQPGRLGGTPAVHTPVASVWATVGPPADIRLPGGPAVRPDVARALGAPDVAMAGFEFRWPAGQPVPGGSVLDVCAADPAAMGPACVSIPVLGPAP
jgi:hypothetical protein